MLTRDRSDEPHRRSFPAMGTRVQVVAAPGSADASVDAAVERVRKVFAREETRFSRFRTESELCRVNARAGSWVHVSRPFAEVTRLALEAARATGGLFDPTVLPALRAAGYDRDFKEIAAGDHDPELEAIRRTVRELAIKDATVCGAWRDIQIQGDRIRMPGGAELDFGGIAKGWTVDLAAQMLRDLPWAIVDAGGDLRIVGDTPEDGLDVAVEDPQAKGRETLRLRLGSGALATSSVTVRAWGRGAHHVIDPRTGLPALTGVLQATVWAQTCAEAEVWSKAALIGGPATLERVPATLILQTGEIVSSFDALEEVGA